MTSARRPIDGVEYRAVSGTRTTQTDSRPAGALQQAIWDQGSGDYGSKQAAAAAEAGGGAGCRNETADRQQRARIWAGLAWVDWVDWLAAVVRVKRSCGLSGVDIWELGIGMACTSALYATDKQNN
ncbi:hypothetical protein V492_01945 [Pseudogymnoascus sp. VKM F-4246]|nr:hypothetical protein V492_01945 [Pseudogymnoascus sp. VKM F-4246]